MVARPTLAHTGGYLLIIFGPSYCAPDSELRLDHVYTGMLPIEPIAFEWPDPVTSAATSDGDNNAGQHVYQTRSQRPSCSRTAA